MQVECGFSHTAKRYKSDFGNAPEAFDAVDAVRSDGEFISRMVDVIVLLVTQIDYAIIRPKPVSMDG